MLTPLQFLVQDPAEDGLAAAAETSLVRVGMVIDALEWVERAIPRRFCVRDCTRVFKWLMPNFLGISILSKILNWF